MDSVAKIRDRLREVYDPELGVNIVDLGLVYDIRDEPNRLHIRMTLTTPGCPLHGAIVEGVRHALRELAGNRRIEVDVVWEPRWSPDMMSDEAKRQLGFL